MPAAEALAALGTDNIQVEKLVYQYLDAQSLKILAKTPLRDAVTQFVDKDDKHAVDQFVTDSLAEHVKGLLVTDAGPDGEDVDDVMTRLRDQQEASFAAGTKKLKRKNAKLKPRPDTWDTDNDGAWEDEPGAWEYIEADEAEETASKRGRAAIARSDDEASVVSASVPTKSTTRKAPAKRAPAKPKAPVKAKGKFSSRTLDDPIHRFGSQF
jgi:double-strand break repair protein MRE11